MATSLNLSSTLTVGNDVSEYTWANQDYRGLVRFERKCTQIMSKMNALAADIADGTAKLPSGGASVSVTWVKQATKPDGKVYAKETTEWPEFPADFVSAFKGVMAGEIADVEKQAKKAKRNK